MWIRPGNSVLTCLSKSKSDCKTTLPFTKSCSNCPCDWLRHSKVLNHLNLRSFWLTESPTSVVKKVNRTSPDWLKLSLARAPCTMSTFARELWFFWAKLTKLFFLIFPCFLLSFSSSPTASCTPNYLPSPLKVSPTLWISMRSRTLWQTRNSNKNQKPTWTFGSKPFTKK